MTPATRRESRTSRRQRARLALLALLATTEGVALVKGQWRYHDVQLCAQDRLYRIHLHIPGTTGISAATAGVSARRQ